MGILPMDRVAPKPRLSFWQLRRGNALHPILALLAPEQIPRALADPTRLRIIAVVTDRGEVCVCELTHALSLAQPKISRHLAVLREAGLLLDRRSARWIYYRLHPELPDWATSTVSSVVAGCAGLEPYQSDARRLGELSIRATGTCD